MRFLLGLILLMFAVVATAAVRTVHVTGTVANIQSWEIRGYYTAMVVAHTEPRRYGVVSTRPQLMVDQQTGQFEGDLVCEVLRNKYGRWVDIHLINMAPTFQGYSTMVIRVPYARTIDLGTFDWKPTRYRRKINPEPGDSMRFEFVWTNSGQPHVARFGDLFLEDYGTVVCDLSFAVRTDTDVYAESWPHHVVLYLQAEVKGRYRLRQVAVQGEHLRDVDFMLDKDLYFTVRDRTGP
jgi:hypothetical protein